MDTTVSAPPNHPDYASTVAITSASSEVQTANNDVAQKIKAEYRVRRAREAGFVDAFHPTNRWTDRDVLGIDLGITLLSAENLRSGNVWNWFMRNRRIRRAMSELFV